jgi:hypothetical protein
MRKNFKSLSDKFSTLNAGDGKDFLSFYEINIREIEGLSDFESDEELYLAVVINHTYGRSQLYERKDYRKAEQFLCVAKTLLLEHKDKFDIELKEDIWYQETLQHLSKTYLTKRNGSKALKILTELTMIDEGNKSSYALAIKEIKRVRKHEILVAIAYIGIALVTISVGYRFIMDAQLWHVGHIGESLTLIGLVGAYFFRGNSSSDKSEMIDQW